MAGGADAPLFWRPEDLPRWQRWQRAQWPASRRAADAARSAIRAARGTAAGAESPMLMLPEGEVHSLVALESFGPTQLAALAAPVAALPPEAAAGVGWVLPGEATAEQIAALPGARTPGVRLTPIPAGAGPLLLPRLAGLPRVLVAGEYLPSGRAAVRWARERGAEVAVVQHGLLAVSTPPVPRESTLYAFTSEDAAWWTQGRADVRVRAVGSALLEDARRTAAHRPAGPDAAGPGVVLGQLHGAELPRADFARAAEDYIRVTGAVYRPHPAEKDRLSRAQHARWEAQGITVDRSDVPLTQTTGPVVSVFSTGVLEAAQSGRPAWVTHPDPPAWLEGFWERYGMRRWRPGHRPDPTPPLASPTPDPAAAIAADLWRSAS